MSAIDAPRAVRIGIVQFEIWSDEDDPKKTLELCRRRLAVWLEQAAAAKADVVVFPEAVNLSTVRPIRRFEPFFEEAVESPEFKLATESAKANGFVVILPLINYVDGVLRNCAFVIGRDGQLVGRYDKVHLTQNEAATGIVPGDSFPTFDLDFGRVGIMICHDMSFPESARCLRLAGADLVFWPSMWSGWGEDVSWTVIKSRAIDNHQYVAFSSYGQHPQDTKWLSGVMSHSSIISPEGQVLAQSERLPSLLTCEIDLSFKRVAPNFTVDENDLFLEKMLGDRRPEAYAPIAENND